MATAGGDTPGDERRAQQALLEAEERFRTFFDLSSVGKAMTAPDGRLIRVNKALCDMLGYSAEELQSRTFASVTHPDDLPESVELVRSLLAGERDVVDVEKRYLTRTGQAVWARVRVRLLRDAAGAPLHLMADILDISDRKATEQTLRESHQALEQRVAERTAELKEANRELEAFSYSVSHDLRAPLRAIEGFSGKVLRDHSDRLDSEGQRLLGVVRTNVLRMSRLVDDLLTFARTSRSEIHLSRLYMTAVARSAFEEVVTDPEMRAKIDFRMSELPDAEGSWSLLHHVWLNLLSNAVKFSARAERPVIAIEGAVEGSFVVYHVRDNGVGFDMAYVEKLFGVFQRLHRANEFEGTGVGLALAKRIVTRHGGKVWAEGAVGKGATFSFSLPALPKAI